MESLVELYRPVGYHELKLIEKSDYKGFPPRLPEQPIFYPVLNREYAAQIAREWNTKDRASAFVGYVTSFKIYARYYTKFEVKVVGDSSHEELWVPAEELEEFNAHLVDKIEVIEAYFGKEFAYKRDELIGKNTVCYEVDS